MAIQIKSNGDNIEISRPFAVSEKRSFHAICSSHKTKLCRSHTGATVVVSVQRNNNRVAFFKMSAHPLDHICMDVRSGPLDSVWQIDNHFPLRSRLPNVDHSVATFQGKI